MQTFNNVQMNGWSCSSKNGPANFTVLKKFFVWMVWNFPKTLERKSSQCFPKGGSARLVALKKFLVWMLCSYLTTIQFLAGPRSPTSLVTTKLISQRWRINSFWCYANFQQRSKEQLILRCWKLFSSGWDETFKNIRTYGLAVLLQTQPSFIHGVEEPFRLDVMQPLKNNQV